VKVLNSTVSPWQPAHGQLSRKVVREMTPMCPSSQISESWSVLVFASVVSLICVGITEAGYVVSSHLLSGKEKRTIGFDCPFHPLECWPETFSLEVDRTGISAGGGCAFGAEPVTFPSRFHRDGSAFQNPAHEAESRKRETLSP
jgi:hypothetical protein